ncbi:MAG: hypothetical protein COA52_14510 [Hyphomicrobiales bacterium]|nr:MAG: hypothetical protein COA52_14510 [Hyphomicrobiales bacterium]
MAADDHSDLRLFIGDSRAFNLRVTPNASANKIKLDNGSGRVSTPNSPGDSSGKPDDEKILRIYVTCAPEDGKANKAVIKLLAKALGVPKSGLQVIRGHKSRTKTIAFL